MKLLFVSTLYPSSTQPARASYSRSLMRAIHNLGHDVRVIAPVFRLPLTQRGKLPPKEEVLDGIPVLHPRIAYLPGLLTRFNHLHYRRDVRQDFEEHVAAFQPDHISVGFAFPDGAAMVPLCEHAGLNWSLQILGSDFRVRTRQKRYRELVMKTIRRAPIVFCPGQALKRDMAATGIDESRIVAFNNGVDSSIFNIKR